MWMKPKGKPTEKSVLVVDDDIHFLIATARILSNRGWTVRTEPDGLRAIQTLQAFCFSAIIADERMPGGPNMTGAGLLEHARRSCPDSHLILMSGWPSSEGRRKTIELGGFVVEKGDFRELMRVLDVLPPMVKKEEV